jgi:hypothetical protein
MGRIDCRMRSSKWLWLVLALMLVGVGLWEWENRPEKQLERLIKGATEKQLDTAGDCVMRNIPVGLLVGEPVDQDSEIIVKLGCLRDSGYSAQGRWFLQNGQLHLKKEK